MNRIILIGNGFDLAHGLKTSYKDFIDYYWKNVREHLYGGYNEWQDKHWNSGNVTVVQPYEDDFIYIDTDIETPYTNNYFKEFGEGYFGECCSVIARFNRNTDNQKLDFVFKNDFLGHISSRCSLMSWVDVENEYYHLLKKNLNKASNYETVKILNIEFNQIRGLLEKYLSDFCTEPIEANISVKHLFGKAITKKEIANCKKEMLVREIMAPNLIRSRANFPEFQISQAIKEPDKHIKDTKPLRTLFLNFNYTNTAKNLYGIVEHDIINIHGELNNPTNPLIFGYGDELDEEHKNIVNLNENECLENIKSINYLLTENYRILLDFMNSDAYQIYVMGHSCGNSDRTLLNTLFEHNNCISIKPFYHLRKDGSEDYIEKAQNIYRNFTDMSLIRDVVVNKQYCEPLPQIYKD